MKIALLISILIFSLYGNNEINTIKDVNQDEFKLGKFYNVKTSSSNYFNQLNMPNVYIGRQCPKKGDCWSVIRNQTGKILRSFSASDSVGTISKGRYQNVAYLYYSHTYGSKKKRKTKYYLVDENHKQYDTPGGSKGMASIITKDRNHISVNKFGVYKNGSKILTNEKIKTVSIANNPNGDIAIAAVLELSDVVILSNLSEWKSTNILLSRHGDRKGILSVYPKDKSNIYAAVYKNVNIYNKGLMVAHVDFSNGKVKKGWVFNSVKKNVGFDPSMYIEKNTIHIGATDSTNKKSIHLVIAEQDYEALGKETPKHIEGFEEESIIDLLVGVGISQAYWYASSKIGDVSSDSDLEYGEVKYDIGESLYKSVYFEGRFGTTNISVAYLENEAEKRGGLAGEASKVINLMVDFDGLVSSSSTLRLKALSGNVNGIATFTDKNNGSTKITGIADVVAFKSEINTYGIYAMAERGYYAGLEYTDYTTPSAVGLSNSAKSVVLYGMDPNFKINTYSLVFGYDELSYAKRYEVDLSRWYIQAMGGVGWADYTLSSEVQKAVEGETGKKINYTGSIALNAEIEYGYIFQQRFIQARGLGYSFTAGYKIRGVYVGAGQSDDSEYSIESDELELEMSRFDVWHGPYASANFIF